MEQANFHKQKLYALIAAAIALVAMILPWASVSFLGMSQSWNGFRDAGFISLLGIGGVVALSLMGNKSENFTDDHKKYTMLSFVAISLGALIFMMRKNAAIEAGIFGAKTGIGVWICLLAGIGGLAFLYGLVKTDKKPV